MGDHNLSQLLAVEQSDRDAAADAVSAQNECAFVDDEIDAIRHGDWDNEPIVQTFARHRLAASPQPALIKVERTPSARWKDEGRADPHGTSYDCERAELSGGHLTDDEVAYLTAMLMRGDLNHEAVLTTAKDRIRWLSRALERALHQAGETLKRSGSIGPTQTKPAAIDLQGIWDAIRDFRFEGGVTLGDGVTLGTLFKSGNDKIAFCNVIQELVVRRDV